MDEHKREIELIRDLVKFRRISPRTAAVAILCASKGNGDLVDQIRDMQDRESEPQIPPGWATRWDQVTV